MAAPTSIHAAPGSRLAVTDATIAFIGGGNMARSLIGGLIARGVPASRIRVVEPVGELRVALARDFGIDVFADSSAAVAGAAIWVLAAKPQVLRGICEALAPQARQQRPLVISIAAGITVAQLARWLRSDDTGDDTGDEPAIVRCMPNTPALIGAGVSGLFANAHVDGNDRRVVDALLASAGKTVWIDDEALMDAVTGVSGSGPAYVFLLAEAMERAALAEGLSEDAARILVRQTLLGAARMLSESNETAAALRLRVTSPGGTTQAAIERFEHGNFVALVADAVHAATQRGEQLSAAND